jgi:hypothetical protein
MIAARRRDEVKAQSREQVSERGAKLANRSGRPSSAKAPSCDDCYFRRNLLCALDLDAPCTTFRANRPEGLVPPRQPVLLMRAPRWASSSTA